MMSVSDTFFPVLNFTICDRTPPNLDAKYTNLEILEKTLCDSNGPKTYVKAYWYIDLDASTTIEDQINMQGDRGLTA